MFARGCELTVRHVNRRTPHVFSRRNFRLDFAVFRTIDSVAGPDRVQ